MRRSGRCRTAWTGLAALTLAGLVAGAARAEAPRPLTPEDARAYVQAFEAVESGDFLGAQLKAAEVRDPSLLGYLAFGQLTHPRARASLDELSAWMSRFRDLPLAERIAARLQGRPAPPKAVPPACAQAERARAAREAFYGGDIRKARDLARTADEPWIGGLAAWRLGDLTEARDLFATASRTARDPWLRSAGAYWAARSAARLGDAAQAQVFLAKAAEAPATFYGLLAERRLELEANAGQPTQILAGAGPDPALIRFTAAEPRAHRTAALMQIGRFDEARAELRAGLQSASTPPARQGWISLLGFLGRSGPPAADLKLAGDHPAPALEPRFGFTLDRALVYAIVRQESRFDPRAVSPAGAVGLMQLMPEAAARAAGDDKLKTDMSPLFDPAFNLRVGQDYFTWLLERGVGPDLLRAVAAYNAGPGTVQRTAQMLGDDDGLLLIESLPALESRAYVEKVLAAYWTYRRLWGQPSPSLDALAMGASAIDPALDLADPRPAPKLAAQPLQLSALGQTPGFD